MKKYGKIFMNGIIDENPTFRMVLGMCPTLAITTAASNGIGMGLAVTFVLIFSNLVISLLRKGTIDVLMMVILTRTSLGMYGVVWATPIAETCTVLTALTLLARYFIKTKPANP